MIKEEETKEIVEVVKEPISVLKKERDKVLLDRIKSYGSANFLIYWAFVVGAGIGGFKDMIIAKEANILFISIYSFTVVFWGLFFSSYYLGPFFQYRRIKKLIEHNEIDEIKEDAFKTYLFAKTKKNLSLAALVDLEEITPGEIISFLENYHVDDGSIYYPLMIKTRTTTIRNYMQKISILWDIDKKYSLFDIILATYFFGVFFLSFEFYDLFFIFLWVFIGFIGVILVIVFGGLITNLIIFRRITKYAKQNKIERLKKIKEESWPTGWKAMYAVAALKDLKEEEKHRFK